MAQENREKPRLFHLPMKVVELGVDESGKPTKKEVDARPVEVRFFVTAGQPPLILSWKPGEEVDVPGDMAKHLKTMAPQLKEGRFKGKATKPQPTGAS